MKPPQTSQSDLLLSIKAGRPEAYRELYGQHRSDFLRWASKRFDLDQDELTDVFQDAVVAFYTAIVEERITSLESSPAAYLFGIARKMLLKKSSLHKRTNLVAEVDDSMIEQVDLKLYQKMEADHQSQLIRQAIDQLGSSCQKLIRLFYFHRYSTEAIKERMGYNSSDVVRSQKLKCIKQLRKIVTKRNT
ncbi:MAG: sigma-70 family RNA polymerase sigma factor [Bacteroidota bacterium]